MADWDQIAKSLSEAGKTAAMGLVDRNRMKVEDYYNRAQEQRANEVEQIRFERNRAAEMADRQKLMKEDYDFRDAFEKKKARDDAELKKYMSDPGLQDHAKNLELKYAAFNDPETKAELDGFGELMGALNEGKLEAQLTPNMKKTLDNMDPGLSQTLRGAIASNYKQKLANDLTLEMIENYRWLRDPKSKEVAMRSLTYEQINKMRDDKERLYNAIANGEKEEKYIVGRQKAIELGIDPFDDPKNSPIWNEVVKNPKNKNSSIMQAYEESWRLIAGLKGMLFLLDQSLYQMDPRGTDPVRYMRELAAEEKRAAGIVDVPEVTEEELPAPPPPQPPGAAHKVFVDTVYEKGIKSLFLNIKEGIVHGEEFDKFKKQMKDTYGDTVKVKDVQLLTNRDGLRTAGKEIIGNIFYDPDKKILVKVVANPYDPTKVMLEPLTPIVR